jgi:hypothetical protein
MSEGAEEPGAGPPQPHGSTTGREVIAVVFAVLLSDAYRIAESWFATFATIGIVLVAVFTNLHFAAAGKGNRLRRFAEAVEVLPAGSEIETADVRMRIGWIPTDCESFGARGPLVGMFANARIEAGQVIGRRSVKPRPPPSGDGFEVVGIQAESGLARHIRAGMRIEFVPVGDRKGSAGQNPASRGYQVLSIARDDSVKAKPSRVILLRVPRGGAARIASITKGKFVIAVVGASDGRARVTESTTRRCSGGEE